MDCLPDGFNVHQRAMLGGREGFALEVHDLAGGPTVSTGEFAPWALFILCGLLLLSWPSGAANAFPAVVTESNLRSVILGQATSFSNTELTAMDINQDALVDVADLIKYVATLGPRPQGVYFEISETTVTEGGTATLHVGNTVGFSGTAYYVLEGTAVCGTDYLAPPGGCSTAPRALTLSGSGADLQIQTVDNLQVSPTRTLIVTLLPDANYALGSAQQQSVYIGENDLVWQASISVDGLVYGFPVEISQNGSTYGVVIRSDGSMGLPVGNLPIANPIASPTTFSITTGLIPVAYDATLLNVPLYRRISLNATAVDFNGTISGTMSESIIGTGAATQFTQDGGSSITGTFVMQKPPSVLPVLNAPLAPCTAPGCT